MYVFLGVGHEAAKLKIQVQEAIAAKSIAEDMNSALQVSVFYYTNGELVK